MNETQTITELARDFGVTTRAIRYWESHGLVSPAREGGNRIYSKRDQTRLNASLTAGDPPDLVRGSPNPNLFARGLAEPLDDFIAESEIITADDLLPVNDLWRWDGSTSG